MAKRSGASAEGGDAGDTECEYRVKWKQRHLGLERTSPTMDHEQAKAFSEGLRKNPGVYYSSIQMQRRTVGQWKDVDG
jgi:hypothetical protein